ncbi:MAG: extracellular solute-binding protein [Clostridiales bacterium]|nr:extracellular solute-binding protein [Clostridiales bacterium]
MRIKKLICVFLGIAMCFGAVGCAFGVDDDVNDGRTRLKISYYKAGYGDEWLKQIGAAFEKVHPDVKIVYDGDYNMDTYIPLRLENAEKGGDVADICTVLTRKNFTDYINKGYLEDLTDLYDEKTADNMALKDVILPDSLKIGRLGDSDKYYGVPWTTSVSGIVYNSKMFAANGWSVPETVDELLALCETIKAKALKNGNTTVAPLVFSGASIQGYFQHLLTSWFRMYEGEESFNEFYKFESAEIFKKQGRLEAYKAEAKLLGNNNSLLGSDNFDYLRAQREFIMGNAAMITAGSWIETEMSAFMKGYPDFEMKIMPMPLLGATKDENGNWLDKTGEKVQHINAGGAGDNFVIPKQAKQKELAKEFLLFMSSQEMLTLYSKYTNSPRPYTYTNSDWSSLSAFGQSAMEVYQKSITVSPYSDTPIYTQNNISEYTYAHAQIMDRAGSETKALEQAQQLFEDDYKNAVERFGAYGG